MMNAWQILDIAPTSDQRAIKRAYALQLKKIDQENNPEDFLRLREALERAQYDAKYLNDTHDEDQEFDFLFEEQQQPVFTTQETHHQFDPIDQDINPPHQHISLLDHLYQTLQQNIEQPHSQHTPQKLQTTLLSLRSHIETLASDDYASWLEKIGYLLYTHDLEHLFEYILPIAQELRTDLFNLPLSANEMPALNLSVAQHHPFDGKNIKDDLIENQAPAATESFAKDNYAKDCLALDQAYAELAIQLKNPPPRFNIHDALFHLPKKFAVLDQHLQQHYQQKFFDLLAQYNYEKWFFFILNGTEPSIEVIDSPLSLVEEDDVNPYTTLHQENQNDLAQQIYQLQHYFHVQDFTDNSYLLLTNILEQLSQVSLEQQIDLKEQLQSIFAYLDLDPIPTDFIRFIQLWDQYYPLEEDCLDTDYASQRLKMMLDEHQHQGEILMNIPENLKSPMQILMQNQSLHTIQMLELYGYLTRTLKIESLEIFLDSFPIQNKSSNVNYLFISLLSQQWQLIWWIIFASATLAYFNQVTDFNSFSHLLFFIIFAVINMFGQTYIAAKILATLDLPTKLKNLNIIWFLSGIILCVIPVYIPENFVPHLYYIWILFGLTLFKIAQYLYPEPIKNLILYSKSFGSDPMIITVAMSGALILCLLLHEHLATFTMGANSPFSFWHIALLMIPIGFILFNEFFSSLSQSFGYKTDAESAVKQSFAYFTFIIFRSLFLALPAYFLLKDPSAQLHFYVASFYVMSLILLMFNRHTSYHLIKYISYFLIVSACYLIDLNIMTMIFSILWLISMRLDWKLKMNAS